MDQSSVLEICRQGFLISLMVTLPVLAIALFFGLAVSVFQAMTQIQEMTLTYVPKLIGAAIIFLAMGSWMLSTLVKFTVFCFESALRVTS